MMKKFSCFVTVFCLALMFTACGGKTETGGSAQEAPAGTGTEEETVDSAESAETGTEEETVDSAESAETETEEETVDSAESAETETKGEEEAVGDPLDSAAAKTAETEAEESSNDAQTAEATESTKTAEPAARGKLLYMGHSSIRITTPEEKVIYIDPYAGDGYEPAADLILVTHGHYDHYNMDKVANRNPDCQVITWQEAHTGGEYKTFDLDFVSVEAVEAGNNDYHSIDECVGYIVTLTDGTSVYLTGDTSTTEQMPSLAEKEIDYAFFCCDGVYNMDLEEAAKCAEMVRAKHNIPYHMVPADSGTVFDKSIAEQFHAPDALIIEDGQEIDLE